MGGQGLVDGGGTEQPAQLLSSHDVEIQRKGPAEQPGGFLDFSGLDETADPAGTDRPSVHLDRRYRHRFDAPFPAQSGEQGRVARPVFPEPVIEAAAHPFGVERGVEDLRHKRRGGHIPDLLEIREEHLLHPQALECLDLLSGGEQLPRAVLRQRPRGLGKGEHRGAQHPLRRLHPRGFGNHRPMAEMHPVEYPQCNGSRRGSGPGFEGSPGTPFAYRQHGQSILWLYRWINADVPAGGRKPTLPPFPARGPIPCRRPIRKKTQTAPPPSPGALPRPSRAAAPQFPELLQPAHGAGWDIPAGAVRPGRAPALP